MKADAGVDRPGSSRPAGRPANPPPLDRPPREVPAWASALGWSGHPDFRHLSLEEEVERARPRMEARAKRGGSW